MRKAFSLFLVLIFVFALAGCHGSKGSEPFVMPDKQDIDKKIEISFWAKNDTNKTQTRIYEKAISDFEALYPNIKVNLRLYTDYGRIYNDVITNIATKTTPNVCITYPDHIATYLTGANVVVPLDDIMTDERYGLGGSALRFDSPGKDEIVQKFLNECSFEGHYYALPYMRSTECLYINKTYVEKMGYEIPDIVTWDFIWEVSEKALEKDEDGLYKVNGQNIMIPFIYKSTDNMMIQMIKQKGSGYSTEDGQIEIFNDTTKELLYTVSEHARTGAFSTFKISSYPGNFLNAGQCIFAVDSTAGATWIGTHAPNSDISPDKFREFETEVRLIPQFDPSDPKMISQGPSVCIFNKDDDQEVLASWLFMQFLLTNEVQTAYAETEGYIPVTLKAQESPEYREYIEAAGTDDALHYDVKIKASNLLRENTDRTFVTPVFNGSASLRDAAGQMIENVTKSERRKEKVDEAYMEKLFKDVNSLYRLDQRNTAKMGEKSELGKLPEGSVILITALIAIWVLLIAYFVYDRVKNRNGNG